MSRVSYLLGAGASYGERFVSPDCLRQPISSDNQKLQIGINRGLPILLEFHDAIQQLESEIALKSKDPVAVKSVTPAILEPLKRVSSEYPTIDTYAKMLYATKHMDEYVNFKNQLAIYFLIWQKCYKHDLRYDSFIASLIDAETCELPPMTILSWNYDMQLEMSYSKYVEDKRALWKIWDALNVYNKTNGLLEYSAEKPFAFLKLNGSAMFHTKEVESSSLRYTLQDVLWRDAPEKLFWNDVYQFYNQGVQKEQNHQAEYINELSYAWEKEGLDKLKHTIAQRVADCEELVVIGYSFPYVNREIDRHIFESMTNLKQIYIQDKKSENIEERIRAIFTYLHKPMPQIVPKDDVDQFFIPDELG